MPLDFLQILKLENPSCNTFETVNESIENREKIAKCPNQGNFYCKIKLFSLI